jgi:hypothetical protein
MVRRREAPSRTMRPRGRAILGFMVRDALALLVLLTMRGRIGVRALSKRPGMPELP